MNTEYQSSEEIQRKNRDAFVDESAQKKQEEQRTEKDKLHRVLDKYIKQHTSTKDVRDLAKKNERSVDAQLNLSADLVEILETIKKDLR